MTTDNKPEHTWRKLAAVMAAAGVIGLAGCNDSDNDNGSSDSDGDGGGDEVTESQFNWDGGTTFNYEGNAPADIAQESDSDYSNNSNGLITGGTLSGWIDGWAAAKGNLTGVDGDLVILQVSTEATDTKGTEDEADDETVYHYIDGSGDSAVRVYAIDTGRLVETRSNGVMASRSMVPSGSQMDQFLADYDIDPTSDMVVWAMGAGGAGNAMRQGRGWYMMRYWGTPQENLAILNGGVNHSAVMSSNVVANTNQDTAISNAGACDENVDDTCPPGGGTVSVADLTEDNLALQATLQDVMAVANGDVADVFVWDARSEGEYMGTAFRTGGTQGHPKGAAFLSYSNLLRTDDAGDNANTYGASYRYKGKTDLANYMAAQEVDGAQFQRTYSGTLANLANEDAYTDGDTVITYCETTFRAMITGVASGVVLGQPTRFYDGAMTEWNHMAHIQTSDGDFLLPNDSPWRTDWDSLSFHKYKQSDISRQDEAELTDAYADDTNAIIDEDRAY